MSDRWAVVDVDMRAPGAPDSLADTDATMLSVTLWWGPAAVGRITLTAEQLPVSREFLWTRFAEFAAPVVAARSTPSGYALPRGDATPPTTAPPNPLDLDAIELELDRLLRVNAPTGSLPDVDVVVCSRGRGADLSNLVRSLADQTHQPRAVIVVDNNDVSLDEMRRQVEQLSNGSYVHEPRRGLSVARNAGIRAGTSPVVAFTDDDATAHPDWLQRLVAPFADDAVDSVTGLVLPAELNGRAQTHFEFESGGLGAGFIPLRFDESYVAQSLPFGMQAWRVGSGANMAIRRSAFVRLGGFDERLGAGASGCSEDSELFYRLLTTGSVCTVDPLAIVWHSHRATMRDLRRQLYAYQRGHVSALVVQFDRHGHVGNKRRAFRQLPRHHLSRARWMLRRPSTAITVTYEGAAYLAGMRFFADRKWRANSKLAEVDR